MIPVLFGAALTYLYFKHTSRGIDKCNGCNDKGQVGKHIKYIQYLETGDEIPYCKKCKPEIFL